MSDSKNNLRNEARKHRARIDIGQESPDDAAALFFETLKPAQDQIIAAYYPIGKEFDALTILEMALDDGFTCALPKLEKDTRIMTFHEWNQSSTMQNNKYGIPEPAEGEEVFPDIIIVPLLSFDRRGTRLGQGGGYYDATLAALRAKKDIIAAGMAWSTQAVLFNLPREPHDEQLDWVITPQASHYFGD